MVVVVVVAPRRQWAMPPGGFEWMALRRRIIVGSWAVFVGSTLMHG